MHASKKFEFMEGQVLQQDQGVTFDLFKPDEVKNTDPEALPKHILIPEVVRETRMHYYQVPRLGSYLAVKLEYNSCLFDEAFDAGLENYAKIYELRAN